jgi:polysaccharide deacetylase family protein (PEP-CTERM system associated)
MRSAGCALTVDVEEWFHICGVGGALAPDRWAALPSRVVANTDVLLEMLDRRRVPATFFVLGCIADRYPRLIDAIRAGGHEIGSHGHMHTRVYEMTPEAFGADLDRSLAALAAAGAPAVSAFRAPEWSINDRSLWALDLLAARGIAIDSSMAPLRLVGNVAYEQAIHRRSTQAGAIIECPPMVSRRWGQNVPGGGGWGLRMRSPRAILRELEARGRAGRASILWVHPWEIDDDPPRVRLPRAKWFAHYFRLTGFRTRLDAILRGASFVPLRALAGKAELG